MEFLGVGYQELLLVLLLTLVVVGPERLPTVAYQIGRAVRTLQRYARVVRDEFQDEFSYIDEQYRTVRGEIDVTRRTLREEQARLESEFHENLPSNVELLPTVSDSAQRPTNAEPSPAAPASGPDQPSEPAPERPLLF